MAYGPFFLPDLSYPFTCPCTCVSTYRPFTGPCTCNGPCTCSPFTGPCTCVCVVRVFAQFSMACVRFRPRRASPTFFPCPRTARSRVRVRVCASYVVLPSFPWRASGSVHDGRRPLFFPCPRTARSRVRVCVCLVRGFAQVSMCARHVPSTTGVGPFFPVSTYSPFTGPCNGPCTCVCVVRGFAQFSMTRVRFRPRRASATFFPCPRTARSRVRVRLCASYVFLPSFPWRASGSVHDGRRPFFPRVHVQPVHGSVYVCVPRTWFCPVFHGAHPLPSTTGVGHFFPVSPCTSLCTWFCLIFHGARPVPSTTLARVSFNTFFVMTSHV